MSHASNGLIERLPSRDRNRLMACCQAVAMAPEQILCEPGAHAARVYFPIDGLVSLSTRTSAGASLEVATVGHEGMVGAQLSLGAKNSWLNGTVQRAGTALWISSAALQAELRASAALQRILLAYVHVLMGQLATAAACAHFHEIGPRLARWLLTHQDRSRPGSLRVTHAEMALCLGVRRLGVTAAAGRLQRSGLIHYVRGALTILDPAGLQAVACSCYADAIQKPGGASGL